jgi:hypothetical protein
MTVQVNPATIERFDDVAPGVLAYDGDEVVGWAAVAPGPSCRSPDRPGSLTWTMYRSGRCGASGCVLVIAARGSRIRCSPGPWRRPAPGVLRPSRVTPWTTRGHDD